MASTTLLFDDLDNASVGGVGQTIDTVSELGGVPGTGIIVKGVVISETPVTAGAVAFQTGVPGAGGITWTTGTPVSAVAGGGAAVIPATAATPYARVIVTTPVVGGKITVIVTD